MLNPTGGLDSRSRALVRFAVAVAAGQDDLTEARTAELIEAGVSAEWVDELLLQSVLMVGYPRALVAAGIWRRVGAVSAPPDDPSRLESPAEWTERGQQTCRVIYGSNYQRLRENVRALHPALDAWMITEGYGRVLSRPALDLVRRELCTVAQIAWLGTPHQLHSHLRGALHAGASPALVDEVLELVGPDLPAHLLESARGVWDRVKQRREGTDRA